MKGDSVEGGCLRPPSLEVYVVSYQDITDVFGDFLLILFINENEGVMLGVLPIIEYPFSSRMVSLIFVAADGDVGGGGSSGCDTLEERRQLILLRHDLCQVRLDKVGEGRDVSEMRDGVVLSNSDREGQVS